MSFTMEDKRMTNEEMVETLRNFLNTKQKAMNDVLNDYFKAQARIAQLENEVAELKEQLRELNLKVT